MTHTSKTEKRLNKALTPRPADIADGIVVLSGLGALDGNPDKDLIAFKAAVAVLRGGAREKVLKAAGEDFYDTVPDVMVKSLGLAPGPVRQILDDAQKVMAMTAGERAADLAEIQRMRDGSHGELYRSRNSQLMTRRAQFAHCPPPVKAAKPASAGLLAKQVADGIDVGAILAKAMKPLTDQIDALNTSLDEISTMVGSPPAPKGLMTKEYKPR